MKRIVIIFCMAMAVNIMIAQSTATIKLDSVCYPPGGFYASLTLEEINNPAGNNSINTFGLYIQYDSEVLGDAVTMVNCNPQFPPVNYLTNIILDVPEPGWNTIAIIYSSAVSGATGYNGMTFFDLQFNYIGPPAASDLLLSVSGMYDDLGNQYDVTVINGYIGPCMVQQPTATLKIGDIIDPLPGTILVPVICEEIESISGNNEVNIHWFIRYSQNCINAGEPGGPATLLNVNSTLLEGCITSEIFDNTPWAPYQTIAFTCNCPTCGEISSGEKFFDIQFTDYGSGPESFNINWGPMGSDDTEMYDEEGNEYYLTLKHGYVGPQPPTATLKIGTIYDPLPGDVLVPVTCEEIDNPLTGNTWISSFGWYIAYDTGVLFAGEPESPATLLNFHPNFPSANYLTWIYQDNPEPGWNTIAIICSPCYNEAFPGIKFFDIQFAYNEGVSEDPNIIWTSMNYFPTNMADDYGYEFLLTLIDGYAGPYYAFDVLFHVTDNTGIPVEGALVAIDSLSFLTDTNGMAAFSLTNGTYDYIISKENYMPETGSFIVAGSAITIEETLNPWYGVTFHVTDDGNDLESAMITVGNDSIATNSSGLAVFNLPDGDYSYTVTKTGYADEEGTFTVAGAPLQIEVEMEHCWDVTIHLISCDSAMLYYNGEYFVIYPNDPLVICLPNGAYILTVYNGGYFEQDLFFVDNSSVTMDIECPAVLYSVTFFVNCCNEPIEGAVITVGTETCFTGVTGNCMFDLPAGFYSFEIGGFPITFTVPDILYVDVDICSETTFHVTNEQGSPIQGVNIEIGGENLVTDITGEADTCLYTGTYSYTATKSGYVPQTGSFVADTMPQTIEIMMEQVTWAITPQITGYYCANDFDDFFIYINGDTIYSGQTIYLPNGSYSISIGILGCGIIVTGDFVVINSPVTLIIDLSGIPIPQVTFHVISSQGGNIAGAEVIVAEDTLWTNSSGEAAFCMTGGDHLYTVTKAGYDTITGTFSFPCVDITTNILMNPVSLNDITSSGFRLYPNPSDGKFYLENLNQTGDITEIFVMEVTGRIIYQSKSIKKDEVEIDLTGKQKGIYFLQVKSGDMVVNGKLIVH